MSVARVVRDGRRRRLPCRPDPRHGLTDPDPTPGQARHSAAVARTLAAADSSAADGNFVNALAWLETLKAIGDALTPEYERKEQDWRAALRDTVREAAGDGDGGLSCPRCGLTIWPHSASLSVRYCPRCMARARTAVELESP